MFCVLHFTFTRSVLPNNSISELSTIPIHSTIKWSKDTFLNMLCIIKSHHASLACTAAIRNVWKRWYHHQNKISRMFPALKSNIAATGGTSSCNSHDVRNMKINKYYVPERHCFPHFCLQFSHIVLTCIIMEGDW